MAYRDYSFYAKLFKKWRRKNGGTIRSRAYEASRDYLNANADPQSTTGAKNNSGIWYLEEVHAAISNIVPAGEHTFNTVGTHTWTAPANVTSVCVVCVGGGGGGASNNGSGGAGGGGGGLGWKNNIPVTPGQSYTVYVGIGGSRGSYLNGNPGNDSYFIDATTVKGGGGEGAYSGQYTGGGGDYVGDGGGNGGNTRGVASGVSDALGGGGAGGYSGNGGGSLSINQSGTAGTGGAGGGGSAGGSSDAAGAGGGVGLYGEGSSGAGGVYTGADGNSGGGGSGGSGGSGSPGSTARPSNGGAYGGGGGGAEVRDEHGSGAQGAVRIIWGDGRAFPYTNVDEASSDGNVSTN